jgi:putative sterol carrier protein
MPAPATPLDPSAFLREHVASRPGRRIAELRSHLARLEREIDERLGAEATIALVLEGDGGGSWYVNLRGGEAEVAAEPAAPPLVRVYQSRADWEALARLQLAAAGGPQSGVGDLTRSRIARLRSLEGAIEFRLATESEEHRTVVQFGAGERAASRCTVSVRAADAARLQAGELTPQAAFMQGLVRLEGDMAFAMQVGATLFV